jgi:hypothetical protein
MERLFVIAGFEAYEPLFSWNVNHFVVIYLHYTIHYYTLCAR